MPKQIIHPPERWTSREVAQHLRVTDRTIYDFAIGDLVCLREFCELSNRYAPPRR